MRFIAARDNTKLRVYIAVLCRTYRAAIRYTYVRLSRWVCILVYFSRVYRTIMYVTRNRKAAIAVSYLYVLRGCRKLFLTVWSRGDGINSEERIFHELSRYRTLPVGTVVIRRRRARNTRRLYDYYERVVSTFLFLKLRNM